MMLFELLAIINIKKKTDTNSRLMIDLHFSIGIMNTLKLAFSFKNWLMELDILQQIEFLLLTAVSLIKHLMIKSAGKIVYDSDNLHNVTFVKNYWNILMIIVVQLPKIVCGIWILIIQRQTIILVLKAEDFSHKQLTMMVREELKISMLLFLLINIAFLKSLKVKCLYQCSFNLT